MNSVEHTLQQFGASIGIPSLRFNQQSTLYLGMQSMGDLYFEKLDGKILIYLIRDLDFPSAEAYRQALLACHPRERHPLPVNAGLRGEQRFAFSILLTEEEFALPTLETCLDLLPRLHNRIQLITR